MVCPYQPLERSAGADYAKFQIFKADNLATKKSKKANYQNINLNKKISQYDMLKTYEISKNQINLERPIKELGVYKINVRLHPDISSEILINVARSMEESKLQENDKELSSSDISDSIEEKAKIRNMFEDETMAEKVGSQNEEIIDNEIISDSKKTAHNDDSDKASPINSTLEEAKDSKDQK